MLRRTQQSFREGATCAAWVVVVGLAFLMWPKLGGGLQRLSFDLPLRFHTRPVPTEAVIVSMDEASFAELKQDPTRHWDRSLHARLVRELTRRGAKVIVFDVSFTAPSQDPLEDTKLGQALAGHGKTVSALRSLREELNSEIAVTESIQADDSIRTNTLWGVADWQLESDGVCRRFPVASAIPSLAYQAAVLAGGLPDRMPSRPWLRFYGVAGTVPTVSYREVLSGNDLSPELFRDKTVFVGLGRLLPPVRTEFRDEHLTPFGLFTGAEIQATAYLNLVRREWLVEVSPVWEFFVISLGGLALGLILACLRPWSGVVVGLFLAIVWIIAGGLLVALSSRWFPWVIPAGVQIPLAAALTVVSRNRSLLQQNVDLVRQKRELQAKLKSTSDRFPGGTPSPAGLPMEGSAAGAPAIPDFALLKVIGRGGYGEVWLAQNVVGLFRAVKVLYRAKFEVPEPYEREFRAIERFMPLSHKHPGLVGVLHVGRNEEQGYFYYVMDLGDDESKGQEINPTLYSPRNLARDLTRRGRLPVTESVELGIKLSEALQFLHQQKLVHRDIKPSNVIFVNGAPRFADVGLVTDMVEEDADISQVGTPAYMAPEGPGGAAADVYSLGKLLYVVGMGKQPRDFPELPSVMIGAAESDQLSALNEIILKAAANDPEERYATADQLAGALRELHMSL